MEDEEREAVLVLYMAMLEVVHINGHLPRNHQKRRDSVRFGKAMEDASRERAWSRRLHASLKEARLIQVPASLYTETHHRWDRRLSEDCGIPWRPWSGRRSLAEINSKKAKAEVKVLRRHTAGVVSTTPFPDRLPFSSTLLTFSKPVVVPMESLMLKLGMAAARQLRHVQLHAIHVSDCGICVEWMSAMDTKSEDPMIPTFFNVAHSETGQWIGRTDDAEVPGGSMDLTPCVVGDLIDHVGSFVDVRVSSGFPKDSKRGWRLGRKATGTERGEPPPDLYPYVLRSSVRTDGGDGPGKVRDPMTHRTDVMAHERLLVRRGPLPIPEKKYEYYIKNGFKVFSDTGLDGSLRRKLTIKGHALKRRDEWLVVKTIWIKQHMNSNDEALPYRRKLTIA